MRLLIVSGGGGHFSPALSVIQCLPKNVEIVIVGRKYALEGDRAISLEYQTATSLGIKFYPITTGRLQRKFTKHTLFSLSKLPFGFFQAISILQKFRPDIVLSFGGYVSLPVVIAAYFLGIPIVIHEQTLEAGLANKIAAFFSKKVCISWETSSNFFPKEKTVLTGNPIREELFRKYQISNEELPLIYITGGSAGSHAVNLLIEGCVQKLLEKYIIVHQTGDAYEYQDFDRLQKLRQAFNEKIKKRYILKKFLSSADVSYLLKNAELVVGRSGMNTITELIFFKKKAILIPLPYSQNNEQVKNALFFETLGLGKVVYQKELTPDKLYELITNIVGKSNFHAKNADKDIKVIIEKASQNIIDILNKEAKI